MIFSLFTNVKQIKQECKTLQESMDRMEKNMNVLASGKAINTEKPQREEEEIEYRSLSGTIRDIILKTSSRFTAKKILRITQKAFPSAEVGAVSSVLYRLRKLNPSMVRVIRRDNEQQRPIHYVLSSVVDAAPNKEKGVFPLNTRQRVIRFIKQNLPVRFKQSDIVNALEDEIRSKSKGKRRILRSTIYGIRKEGKIKKDKRGLYYIGERQR